VMGEERGKEGTVGMRRVGMIGLPVIFLSSCVCVSVIVLWLRSRGRTDYRYRFLDSRLGLRVVNGVDAEWGLLLSPAH